MIMNMIATSRCRYIVGRVFLNGLGRQVAERNKTASDPKKGSFVIEKRLTITPNTVQGEKQRWVPRAVEGVLLSILW